MSEIQGLLVIVAIFVGLPWLLQKARRVKSNRVAKDRFDLAYEPYTTEYDLELRGRDLGSLRNVDSIGSEYPAKLLVKDASERKKIAEDCYTAAVRNLGKLDLSAEIFDQTAIAILVDLSGSMANRLPELSGQIAALVDKLETLGTRVCVLGFTTHGWRGGEARLDWIKAGRPAYPGRLCALKHIRFKEFDEPRVPDDWDAMLDAEILRENVDGEAIRWAKNLLERRKETHRVLLVFSDGAPVDDSTLMENGKSYLYRHLEQVISEEEAEGHYILAAVGIEHRVESLYSNSMTLVNLSNFTADVASFITNLLRPAMVGVAKKPD